MRLKPWFVFLAPLLLVDASLIFVVAARRHVSSADTALPVSVPATSSTVTLFVTGAVPHGAVAVAVDPTQVACIAGARWVYDSRSMRWSQAFMRGRPVVCTMRGVRDELRHEGVTEVHPKGWQPSGPNLTQ